MGHKRETKGRRKQKERQRERERERQRGIEREGDGKEEVGAPCKKTILKQAFI